MNYRVWVGNERITFRMYAGLRDVMRELRRREDFMASEIDIFEDTPQSAFVASKKSGNKNFFWKY